MVKKIKNVPMDVTRNIATLVYLPGLVETSLDKCPSCWHDILGARNFIRLSKGAFWGWFR
jgi:hypothetical protein